MARTSPFPDVPRAGWATKILVPPHVVNGLTEWAEEIYPSAASMNSGDLPFLINSFKAMIRTGHQRIITRPSGALVHVSGAEVLPEDVEDFLANDPTAYNWVTMTDSQWEDERGRKLAPWKFPTYWGIQEGLDPQWSREKYLLASTAQVAAIQARYYQGAENRRLAGDHRGTTIDLQVGAAQDDIRHATAGGSHQMNQGGVQLVGQHSSLKEVDFWARFLNVTIPRVATIDVSYLTITATGTRANQQIDTLIFAEDSAAPPVIANDTDWHNRTLTTANVDYGDGATNISWTVDVETNLPGMVTVTQELVDRADWANGNKQAYFWDDAGSPTVDNYQGGYAYDTDTAKAAKLHVEYTGGETFTPRALAY